MIRLPGLIDVHVHFRDPGQTHKEDFGTGTQAALAGGFTFVLDMPNNLEPITTISRLKRKSQIAKRKAVCDVGFYFGSLGDNLKEFKKVQSLVYGLKLYLNETTGNFLIDKTHLRKIFDAWSSPKPILLHAEDDAVAEVIRIVTKTGQKVHFCHITTAGDLKQIIKAKEKGLPVSCGVTPHHLFLTNKDVKILGPFGRMKPSLKSQKNQDFLWKKFKWIDIVESDHAPHTIEEKKSAPPAGGPPYGVPGLETTLPLLLTAVHEKRLTIEDVIDKLYTNPKKIFNIPDQPNTWIEISDKRYEIRNRDLMTKCGWSPFDGWKVRGKVTKVVLRNKRVF